MASVAVCSSMFSSWHSVSKLLRTELSSILPDSESDDSSPRIRKELDTFKRPKFKTCRGRRRRKKNGKKSPRVSVWATKTQQPPERPLGQQPPGHPRDGHASARPSHNAARWRENRRAAANHERGASRWADFAPPPCSRAGASFLGGGEALPGNRCRVASLLLATLAL